MLTLLGFCLIAAIARERLESWVVTRDARRVRDLDSRKDDGSLGPRGQHTWDRGIRAAGRRQRRLDRWAMRQSIWERGGVVTRALAWLLDDLGIVPVRPWGEQTDFFADHRVNLPFVVLWRHSADTRRELGTTLARHGLTPWERAQRACFYVLLGQIDR